MTDRARAGLHWHDFVLTERKRNRLRRTETITFTCTKCDETWTKEWFCEPPIYSANDERYANA